MADKLLIRAYNVEVGDCIYCRIPQARVIGGDVDDFHILIDCGSVGGTEYLNAAIANLRETMLPDAGDNQKRIDLLVVTHEHKDHIAGFDPAQFKDIKIENVWMNTAMDPDNPQAGKTLRLHGFAVEAMRNLANLNLAMSPELQEIVALFGIDNDSAMLALRETLPKANGIQPTYVHAGLTSDDLKLPLDEQTRIHVLAPERDIDHFYLGKEMDEALRGLAGAVRAFNKPGEGPAGAMPTNISPSEFRRLQSRMLSSAFAFAELSGKVTNNTSVVLLIEWKTKRLLFVGDAEWDNKFREEKANGSWNVMWHRRNEQLNAPIDFLKIGHHGSVNATPWNDRQDGQQTEPSQILDAILPLASRDSPPTAKAVVSTKRKNYATIPSAALLVELGRRVANVRNYLEELGPLASELPNYKDYEEKWLNARQPWRTDCEHALTGANYVDVEIEA